MVTVRAGFCRSPWKRPCSLRVKRRTAKATRERSPARCEAAFVPLASLCDRALGAPALVLLEMALAQADRLRRDLGELVVADELDRVLERELDRRREQDRLVLARGADIGELLGADRVDHEVVVAAVDADDHALVYRLAGVDEHAAALLQLPQRIGHGDAIVL